MSIPLDSSTSSLPVEDVDAIASLEEAYTNAEAELERAQPATELGLEPDLLHATTIDKVIAATLGVEALPAQYVQPLPHALEHREWKDGALQEVTPVRAEFERAMASTHISLHAEPAFIPQARSILEDGADPSACVCHVEAVDPALIRDPVETVLISPVAKASSASVRQDEIRSITALERRESSAQAVAENIRQHVDPATVPVLLAGLNAHAPQEG